MNPKPTKLELQIVEHAIEGIELLIANLESNPETALAIATELNNIRESVKATDKLSDIAKKRILAVFTKIGTPVLLLLKERFERDERGFDPSLN